VVQRLLGDTHLHTVSFRHMLSLACLTSAPNTGPRCYFRRAYTGGPEHLGRQTFTVHLRSLYTLFSRLEPFRLPSTTTLGTRTHRRILLFPMEDLIFRVPPGCLLLLQTYSLLEYIKNKVDHTFMIQVPSLITQILEYIVKSHHGEIRIGRTR
jgi:hypothetical protein